MTAPLHLDDVFDAFSDVEVARGAGEFPEHAHDDTDEFFLVLAGRLHLDLPDRTVTLGRAGPSPCPAACATGHARRRAPAC